VILKIGISMRTIRRHRLDDPRITDEVRAVLVQAAMERQSKARCRRSEQSKLARIIRLASIVTNATMTDFAVEPTDEDSRPASLAFDPLAVPASIQLIRQCVCEHFYMSEMRDPETSLRKNRRAYVLPRQVAMYIARQLTGASLQEIGREFGNRHHTTALHSINKIVEIRRSDCALDLTIIRLMEACASQCRFPSVC